MKRALTLILIPLLLIACHRSEKTISLSEARQGFKTKLTRQASAKEPVPVPPPNLFTLVRYDAPSGKLAAYLSPDPQDGKKYPAIIWITGGDSNTIGDVWSEAPESNDQTASAFRKAGILMMFPSLRGGNDNPGFKEGFLGEVDDILAAAKYLQQQPHVDANRIYLGGHSTGGTLALLVASLPNPFRAVFSFGPAASVAAYPTQFTPFSRSDPREIELRSPQFWLPSIQNPTFVFEGYQGNRGSLQEMKRISKNPKVRFYELKGNHFNILAPVNRLIADKILKDDGMASDFALSEDELSGLLQK